MNIRTLITVALCAVSAWLVIVAGTGHSARAESTRPVSVNSQACGYFHAWQHGHSPWNLDAMMASSVYATWNPIGTDAVVLYTDVRSGENTTDDVKDMTAACKHPR